MRGRRARLAVASVIATIGMLGALAGPAGAATKPTGAPIPIEFVNLDTTSSTTSARQGANSVIN